MTWFEIITLSFLGVFSAELLGDRTLVAVMTLSLRTRILALLGGLIPAFLLKMGVAVLLGNYIQNIPQTVLIALSVATFAGLAINLWREDRSTITPSQLSESPVPAFATVFLSEWADPGQLTAAVLSARLKASGAVWVGAVLAMSAKSVVAICLGRTIARVVPARVLRYVSISTALALAVACLIWRE